MKIRRLGELTPEEMQMLQAQQQRLAKSNNAGSSILPPSAGDTETVNVARGLMLGKMLEPQDQAEEKKARFEALRQSIQDGSYLKSIDSAAFANKFSDEIGVEIASYRLAGILDE